MATNHPATPATSMRWSGEVRLNAALSGSGNALNSLRLGLALLVIVAHTIPISGIEWLAWVERLGPWAVLGFFVISGYLIAGSRLRSSWWSYVIRRVARIYPGYWVQLLVVALMLAPLATWLGASTWSWGAALDYVVGNASTFRMQYLLEGTVFPHHDAWNGSAWTLMYELLAYAGCLLVFSIPWCRRHVVASSAAILIALIAFTIAAPVLDVTTSLYLNAAHLGSYFAAGMLAYGLRERLLVTWRLTTMAMILVILLFMVPGGDRVAQLPVAYAVLALGALAPLRIGVRHDLSYGTYIYAFPVQQVVAMTGAQGWIHLLISTLVTLVFAWASWRLVEQPSMQGSRVLISWIRDCRGQVAAARV
ncbi:MAG: acyltransferase family protein [Propioniciclava sp.]